MNYRFWSRQFLILVLAWGPMLSHASANRVAKIENGLIDFTKSKPKGNIELEGQWFFWWQQDENLHSLERAARFINVPGSWTSVSTIQNPVTENGWAVYGLTLKGVPQGQKLVIPSVSSAYKVAVLANNKIIELGKVGTFSKIRFNSLPWRKELVVSLPFYEQMTLLIYVSNFEIQYGGIFFNTFQSLSSQFFLELKKLLLF